MRDGSDPSFCLCPILTDCPAWVDSAAASQALFLGQTPERKGHASQARELKQQPHLGLELEGN